MKDVKVHILASLTIATIHIFKKFFTGFSSILSMKVLFFFKLFYSMSKGALIIYLIYIISVLAIALFCKALAKFSFLFSSVIINKLLMFFFGTKVVFDLRKKNTTLLSFSIFLPTTKIMLKFARIWIIIVRNIIIYVKVIIFVFVTLTMSIGSRYIKIF